MMPKTCMTILLLSLLLSSTSCVRSISPVHKPVYDEDSENEQLVLPDAPDGSIGPKNQNPLESEGTSPQATTLDAESKPPEPSAQSMLDESLEFCEAAMDFWGKGDLENALLALDKAYSLIVAAKIDDDPLLVQQKEDIRYLISKRILEIHASRRTAVSGKHNAIPLQSNKEVQLQIKLFQNNQRGFFENSINRSSQYRSMILKAVEKAGLPKELAWLPLIESGFKIRALSPARALGLWQFIPSTGYRFGLRRDEWIDERMDPEKATQAAIAYLQELHDIFGDWCTVLAAYNCGENRVLRVIRGQKINYLDHFWDLYFKLPLETRQYVPRFLAALIIIEDPKKYGFDFDISQNPIQYDTITVSKQLRIEDIAKIIEVDPTALKTLNAELRHHITPPASYDLKIPLGMNESDPKLAEKVEALPVYKPPTRRYAYHRIRSGDTLSHLAVKYRTTIKAIARANHVRTKSLLRLGKRLRIPVRGAVPKPPKQAPRKTKKKPAVSRIRHRIQSGDSLWSLAKLYNTTVEEIKKTNKLKNEQLNLGQEIIVIKNQNNGKQPLVTKKYVVKQGDSPYSIAVEHDMELERFLHLNQLTPTSTIFPDQVVQVND